MSKISQYFNDANKLASPVTKVLGDIDSMSLGNINNTLLGTLDTSYGIADSYKPFDFDTEVSYRPAIQQWMVCTP